MIDLFQRSCLEGPAPPSASTPRLRLPPRSCSVKRISSRPPFRLFRLLSPARQMPPEGERRGVSPPVDEPAGLRRAARQWHHPCGIQYLRALVTSFPLSPATRRRLPLRSDGPVQRRAQVRAAGAGQPGKDALVRRGGGEGNGQAIIDDFSGR